MQIKIQRDELLTGLAIVDKALSSKSVIESLKGIKIEAKNNQLTLTGSKSDLVITYTVKGNYEIIEPGTIILHGHYLHSIIKNTFEEYITFSEVDNKILIKTNRSKIQLTGFDITTYPEVKFNLKKEQAITLPTEILTQSLKHTRFAVGLDNSRPLLTAINFDFNSESLRVGSTDARRCAIACFNGLTATDKTFNINKGLLADICGILEISKCQSVSFSTTSNNIELESDSLKLKANLIDGQYPDLNRIIPEEKNISYSYEVNSHELLLVLEKIVLLSDRESGNVTTEIIDDNVLLKSGFKDLGAMEEFCNLENISGTPFPISFNPKLLKEAIHALGAERLRIAIESEVSPFKITDVNNTENIQVISPIRMG